MKTAKKAALVIAAAGMAAGAASGTALAMDGNGATAQGATSNSPGAGSGNLGQLPVHVPVNATGNTGNVIGGLNPAFGNQAANS
ncbi:chaplin [Streptomyces sp. NPDC050504]|uniref:chaplin n=1 Tax=Streptomyces sp. NPDC050504 TaxID=3365618 RepID=UPI0037A64D18